MIDNLLDRIFESRWLPWAFRITAVVCLIVLMLTVVKHPEDENGCIYDSPKTALAHQACINNLEKP